MTVDVKEGRFYQDGLGEKRGPMEPTGRPEPKPEPVRKTIKARVCITEDGVSYHMEPKMGADAYSSGYYYAALTFTVINRKADWANAKLEALE